MFPRNEIHMKVMVAKMSLLLGILLVQNACGADWSQFRGPLGNGHATDANPPLLWNAKENITWRVVLPGQGWSSPVISGGHIYLTAAVPSGDGFFLRAMGLDVRSGKTIWNTEIFAQSVMAPAIHGKNSHASPTPVLVDDRLYVHFGHQGTACLDLKGNIIWKIRRIDYSPVHGNGGSPIVAEGKLIFSVDGANKTFIVALDTRDGSEVWRRQRESEATRKFSFSTPVAVDVNGRTQIISPGTDVVHALDLEDGSVIWHARYDGYSVIPRPVFGHGMIYITTGYGAPSVLAIAVDGTGDVTDTHIRWRTQRGAPHTPSLLLVKDELYMVSDRGVASCLDARTGEPHWQERVGTAYSASPVFASGRIYLMSEEGVGTVLAADKVFKSLGVNDLKERSLASYGVAGDSLIIRTAKHLYRVESK